jgi:magnesium transporter
MIEVVVKKTDVNENINFQWVSLIDPSLRELAQISVQYDLHSTSVHDCLEPEHLPKFEQINDVSFIITRAYDEDASPSGDTVRKLTNKIAIFASHHFLITIHRQDHDYLKIIRNKWRVASKGHDNMSMMILVDIYTAIVNTYETPILNAMEELEHYEKEIFTGTAPASIIQKMYLLRRRTAVYKKMLYLFNESLVKKSAVMAENAPYMQDVIDTAERLYYNAEQLLEDATNLLNIHLSLASHRTNEVMRVLTILTVFFLPLTFIVGVYGMNFEFMPELKWKYGYYYVWTLMFGITITIYFWFRNKGWLND